jgi:uncharacterized metal-binding protein YceD (DUF177 family)
MSDAPAFSRPLDIRRLPAGGDVTDILATAGECAALAGQLKLPDLADLKARLAVTPTTDGVAVSGEVSARVTQVCVVSLDPFETEVSEVIDIRFAREGSAALRPPREGDPEAELPDLLEGDHIDLGVIAAEFLALGLDPWPRKPGATLPEHETGDVALNPFAVLSGLKRD